MHGNWRVMLKDQEDAGSPAAAAAAAAFPPEAAAAEEAAAEEPPAARGRSNYALISGAGIQAEEKEAART
jgi:hypothetical protein